MSAYYRIVFIAQLVELWVVHPNVLHEFELANETGADHERRNTAIGSILRSAFRQRRPVCRATTQDLAPIYIHGRVTWIHPADMRAQRHSVTLGVHLRIVEVVIALRVVGERRIIFVGRKHKGGAASPAAHQFCRDQLLVICGGPALLAQKIAEGADVLVQPPICHVAAVTR